MQQLELTNSQRMTFCKSKGRTNNKRKDIHFFILLLCGVINAFGQNDIKPTLDLDNYKRGLSPQVALMNRFVDYPVDLQYGLVDISVPLYTIQTNNLIVPLQLKFHASGLMADEREGLLGIRWALAGGGQVTRIIKGYADEFRSFNTNVSDPNHPLNFYDLYGTTGSKSDTYMNASGNNSKFLSGWNDDKTGKQYPSGEYKDTEYDIFSYSLPSGKSGKFLLKDVNGSKTACLMPYEPMLITVGNAKVKIVDENGITYYFGSKLETNDEYIDGNSDGKITTWHLSTIISANKSDTVFFDYKRSDMIPSVWDKSLTISFGYHEKSEFTNVYDVNTQKYYTSALYDMIGERLTDPNQYFKRNNINNPVSINAPYYINSIKFKGGGMLIGYVNFIYDKSSNGCPKYLNDMQVFDAQNSLVKKIGFTYNPSTKFKLLDRIEYKDIYDPTKKEVYSFEYFDSSLAPSCGDLSKNSDWWGYYSSSGGWLQSENFVLNLPLQDNGDDHYVSMTLNDGDKKTQPGSMKMGMLKKIHYPTGGTEEFEYEANKFGEDAYCGGLRIYTVKKTAESGKVELRRYVYSTAVMPSYLYPPALNTNIYTENEIDCLGSKDYDQANYYGTGQYYQQSFQNTFPSRYSDMHSNVVNYSKVTEFIENNSGGVLGKTEYNYNIILPTLDWFDKFGGNGPFIRNSYSHGYVSPKDFWKGNKLSSKIVYDNTLTKKVKENIYEYTPFTKESVYDLPVYRYRLHMVHLAGSWNTTDDKTKELMMIHPDECSDCLGLTFAIKHQEYTIGAEKLTKETENTYDDNGTKSSIVNEFTYDPDYLLPVSESITNSNGDVIQTKKQYSFNDSASPYDKMVSNNILSDVIRSDKYKNNTLLESEILNYMPFPSTGNYNTYRPESVVKMTNGVGDIRIHSMLYDRNGNLQNMTKDENTKIVYLWSYNYQYPVAKIEGLDYGDVEVTLNNNLGTNYISTLAQTALPTAAQIASIRSGLASKNALITTYTYVPLIGMVSATDPRGLTTTYTYDGFNRLLNIKNDDSKVLNQYKYHYYNQ